MCWCTLHFEIHVTFHIKIYSVDLVPLITVTITICVDSTQIVIVTVIIT